MYFSKMDMCKTSPSNRGRTAFQTDVKQNTWPFKPQVEEKLSKNGRLGQGKAGEKEYRRTV